MLNFGGPKTKIRHKQTCVNVMKSHEIELNNFCFQAFFNSSLNKLSVFLVKSAFVTIGFAPGDKFEK